MFGFWFRFFGMHCCPQLRFPHDANMENLRNPCGYNVSRKGYFPYVSDVSQVSVNVIATVKHDHNTSPTLLDKLHHKHPLNTRCDIWACYAK